VNPISKATSAIIHPVRTASTLAGQTVGVAAAGVRTTMRIIDRAAGQRGGDSASTGWSTTGPAPTQDDPETSAAPDAATASATAAPAKKATATKARPRKTAAKKAPSARAATVGPALSEAAREAIEDDELRTPSGIPAADEGHNPDTAETDLHQPGTEPLMDPATVKSAKSHAEVMQRAADPDKG
jgi:hypothetical protein